MNTIPNLDCETQEALWAFWKRYARPTRKDAEALIGDRRKGFTVLASTLASYACNIAVAMECRERGDIQAAQIYEHAAQLCYDRLPEDLRW